MPQRPREIELPYGDGTIRLRLPPDPQVTLLQPRDLPAVDDLRSEVRRAMAEPIASPPLGQLARGREDAVIVVDDATRPVPTAALLRPIVDELQAAGLETDRITVVVATGLHRAASDAEQAAMLGGLPLRILSHDARDPDQLVAIGTTSQGTPLRVNRTVAQSDLRILTGDVELHQFVGYGGGAKSVLPGICDAACVQRTHARMEDPGAGPGRIDDNPIRQDVEQSADLLGVDFIVNVVLNSRHQVVRGVAGDVHQAFRAGIALVDRMFKLPVAEPVDAVICSPGGFPKDINLYQSQKAIRAARRIVRRGGEIFALAECRDGHGSRLGLQWAREAGSPQAIIDRHRRQFVMGGHKAYQLAVDVQWSAIHLLSQLPREIVQAFFLRPLDDARQVEYLAARCESIAVLPQASSTLPLLAGTTAVDF